MAAGFGPELAAATGHRAGLGLLSTGPMVGSCWLLLAAATWRWTGQAPPAAVQPPADDPLAELNALGGVDGVKAEVNSLVTLNLMAKRRRDAGRDTQAAALLPGARQWVRMWFWFLQP